MIMIYRFLEFQIRLLEAACSVIACVYMQLSDVAIVLSTNNLIVMSFEKCIATYVLHAYTYNAMWCNCSSRQLFNDDCTSKCVVLAIWLTALYSVIARAIFI